MAENKKRSSKVVWFFIISLILSVCGGWVADRLLKQRDHPGLRTFVSQWYHNYPKSFAIEPKLLSITVGQYELDRLQSVVDAARERGVIIPEGNEYVAAELTSEGRTFKAKIRIKGKMTDHVKGDKWSFRVIAKKDGGFLGMKRFSLQHPGTRNYLYEWFHQQLAKGEGMVALRYGFIRLEFNGEDRGIYAYEEHFAPDLLENNSRVEGPIFRFDPGLFWVHRLNAMNGLRFDEAFAAYQAAAVDAYGTGGLEKDSIQRRYFEEAVALMGEFRHGRSSASQVFDADLVAMRIALLDVLGGHRSLDWSDAKFYFDPVLKRIEPIAYESFSAQPIRDIAGSNQWMGTQRPWQDLYTAWFNDPVLFRAYVHHLERFSKVGYLDSALNALRPALDSASATVYGEFPYKELDRSTYAHNQKIIKAVLDVPKGFHAYRGSVNGDTLSITTVPIGSLPIEVHGVQSKSDNVVEPLGPSIIPIRPKYGPGDPFTLRFLVTDTTLVEKDIRLIYSVLGSSVRKELSVFPFELLDGLTLGEENGKEALPLSRFGCLVVDEPAHTITFRSGNWVIDKDLIIPKGYVVSGTHPLRLDLKKGARIISASPISLQGREDADVVILSSDSSGGSLRIANTTGNSKWNHVRCEGFGPSAANGGASFEFQMADIVMANCTLAEVHDRDLMTVVRSKVVLTGTELLGGLDQVTMAYSQVRVQASNCSGAGDDALVVRGGELVINNSNLTGVSGIGIKVKNSATLVMEGVQITSTSKGVECSEASTVKWNNGSLKSGDIGIDVQKLEMRYGPSKLELNKVDLQAKDESISVGKGNSVLVNGKAMEKVE